MLSISVHPSILPSIHQHMGASTQLGLPPASPPLPCCLPSLSPFLSPFLTLAERELWEQPPRCWLGCQLCRTPLSLGAHRLTFLGAQAVGQAEGCSSDSPCTAHPALCFLCMPWGSSGCCPSARRASTREKAVPCRPRCWALLAAPRLPAGFLSPSALSPCSDRSPCALSQQGCSTAPSRTVVLSEAGESHGP